MHMLFTRSPYTRCSSEEHHLLSLLTLTQSFLTTDKQVFHYPILRIFVNPAENTVVVTTQLPKDQSSMLNEDVPVRVFAILEIEFNAETM